ncbi:uncharacterized protein MEPE_00566 [Melanopsichium pennsylvanicum]|uniref:Zn(2)-C6 fungal-type domain-containing protein n=2 Tax=Melanopsichium pennsylvanicum TaxID=63383 RepID=A0AAJ4XGY5_9BASI|nr:nucleus protein [Melanopsichium pennsylvanicum 4]SNX81861.1 uncharacterized protein MEPE_00566 [Melanopsichium pennsylvanicum]
MKMDADPSRGPQHPRDRPPPPHDPSYGPSASFRDETFRTRPPPDPARRYSRTDLEQSPMRSRGHAGWPDQEPPPGSFGTREGPPLPRSGYSYPVGARSGPYSPSDLPRPSRSSHPDEFYAEYYAEHPPQVPAPQDGAIVVSHPPPHRLTPFGDEVLPLDGRGPGVLDARDPYLPPRRLSGAAKAGSHSYAEAPFHSNRQVIGHFADPRSDPTRARPPSPGPMPSAYPSAVPPPRRISDASPPYSSEPADLILHRDKKARLDLYTERAPPGPDTMLRPPPLRTSSSHRSVASTTAEWTDRGDLRDRQVRPSFHADSASKVGRFSDWPESERAHLSRRTSAVSHNSLDYGHGQGSEAMSSPSNKVKRRKRAVLSCTECKQRKIKCDRNVPNCGSCVRRGVAHLCRWGDERDFLPAAPASNITPSNAALMARIAQLEAQVRVLQSSSTSPSAVHDASASERGISQRGTTKYGASDSSGSRSSCFPGPSSIHNPPDFTSRDRTTAGSKHNTDYASRRGALGQHNEEEEAEESEQSDDSAESGAENAGDLLRALAHGSSLKDNSRNTPPRRNESSASDKPRTDGSGASRADGSNQADIRDTARESHGSDIRRSFVPVDEERASTAIFDIFTPDVRGNKTESLNTVLLEAMDLLPSRYKIEALIDHYLCEAEPLVQSIHKPSLLKRLHQFWTALDSVRDAASSAPPLPLPDMQFAAMLLAMCEAACEFMTPAEVLDSEICISRTSINDRLALLARTSLALLSIGQFVRRPDIWGLQTIIVLRHYCYNRDVREEYTILCTMAVKAAEFMGLHRLGSALTDEERWQDEKRARGQSAVNGKGSASASAHRWKLLTSTQIHDGFETDSDGEDLDPDRRERADMNAMWLPRGARRRNWDLAATKRYEEGSRVSRELGRKVWFAFATLDWLSASFFDRCYHCKDEMFTTQSPQNIDDGDLTDSDSVTFDDSHDSDRPPRAHNPFLGKIRVVSVPTNNSFIPIHIEFCHTVRSIADALNHGDESFETVLAIEARFREILRSLPRFFKLNGESEYDPEIHQLHRERPYLSVQRAIIHESIHHRLLKLHRLYMSRGYRNAKYIHSTRTCIESARVVIGTLRALDKADCRAQRHWIFKFHIFHAVLALQVDLLYLARQPVNREILAKRADVVAGLKMLHARTDIEGRNPLLASSLKVMKVLREEEQARRAKHSAGSEASAGSEHVAASSPSNIAGSEQKSNGRDWTAASESTGDLAEHLERRIKETWYTVEVDKLHDRAAVLRSMAADTGSPATRVPQKLEAISRTPSTEDVASLRTAADVKTRGGGKNAALDGDLANSRGAVLSDSGGSDTELDDYLKLLSSYQNPDDAPGGAHFFEVLDDMALENGSTNKLAFGKEMALPLIRDLSPPLPMLRGATDLAAAGAGFDAFTTT